LPHHALDVIVGRAGRHLRGLRHLFVDGIGVAAGDAEQASIDVDREAAAQSLRDIADRTDFEIDLDAGRNGDGLDRAPYDEGLVFARIHGAFVPW